VLENIHLIRQFGLPKPANSRSCCSNLFIELGTATADAGQFLRLKRREKPSNVRISLFHIITFDGFFDSESDILKPRWLPTGARLDAGGRRADGGDLRHGEAWGASPWSLRLTRTYVEIGPAMRNSSTIMPPIR
jgi:hypothetical protein